jgi:hypothetical protein
VGEALSRGSERARHVLVGLDGRGGEVPSASLALRAGRGGQAAGQRAMCAAALVGRPATVGERAQQRMAEAHAVVFDRDRARALGLGERVGREVQAPGRCQHDVRALRLAGGGDQQRAAGGLRQRAEPLLERVRDQAAGRQRLADPEPAGQPVVADGGGDLERGERVAVRRAREAVAQVVAERSLGRAVDEGGDRVGLEPGQGQALEARGAEARRDLVAERDQHADGLAGQPPRGEAERLERRAVDPVRVIDCDEQRRVGGRTGEQAEDGGKRGEAVDGVVAHGQRAAQGSGLRPREVLGQRQHRVQELVQARERQLGLVLGARGAQHADLGGPLGGRPQQRGLADPGLSGQHEDGAAAGACVVQQDVDPGQLRCPADQHVLSLLAPGVLTDESPAHER